VINNKLIHLLIRIVFIQKAQASQLTQNVS